MKRKLGKIDMLTQITDFFDDPDLEADEIADFFPEDNDDIQHKPAYRLGFTEDERPDIKRTTTRRIRE